MTIEERVEKIEKKNEDLEKQNHALKNQTRKLRRLSLASIALALAALIGGTALSVRAYTAAIEPDKITTKHLYIKDSSGMTRVYIGGGVFDQYDASGKRRIYMATASPDGGAVMILKKSDGTNIWVQVAK